MGHGEGRGGRGGRRGREPGAVFPASGAALPSGTVSARHAGQPWASSFLLTEQFLEILILSQGPADCVSHT